VNTAIEQLLAIEEEKQEGVISGESLAVGMARLGQPTQKIVYGTLNELKKVDFGAPLHSLALCGDIHPLEKEVSPSDMNMITILLQKLIPLFTVTLHRFWNSFV
jgi:diphthine synthase